MLFLLPLPQLGNTYTLPKYAITSSSSSAPSIGFRV